MSFRIIRRTARRNVEEFMTQEVPGEVLRIGRGTDNDLHLDDFSVSYSHAVIERLQTGWVLRDLTGLSRTLVNGAPQQDAALRDGDIIAMGVFDLHVSIHGDVLQLQVTEDAEQKSKETVSLLPRYALSHGRWRKAPLTVLLSALVLLGAVAAFGLGRHQFFMPGGISLRHLQFAADCSACHTPWKPVWTVVADDKCQTCHAAPSHFGNRSLISEQRCASCHTEHQASTMLAKVHDQACLRCHADLKAKEPRVPIEASVHEFPAGHPEFAVTVGRSDSSTGRRVRLGATGLLDASAIKLNHKLHLDPELRGPDGPEPLTCTSCHQPDERGAYLKPIRYDRDCQRCHVLDFDERFPGKTVPHGQQPAELHQALLEIYSAHYVFTHEGEARSLRTARRLAGERQTAQELFVDEMAARAERYLYARKSKKCLLCHQVEDQHAAKARAGRSQTMLPRIVKTGMPTRWLPYSHFNHAPHLSLPQLKDKGCASCHAAASTSVRTEDVLISGMASCRDCHFKAGGAQADCISCHLYHDQAQAWQLRYRQR